MQMFSYNDSRQPYQSSGPGEGNSVSVEILGMITATPSSEVDQPLGEAVDAGFVRRFAQAHEDAGFDRVLVGYFSNAAEGAVVSSFVAAATRRLGVLLAYRPG